MGLTGAVLLCSTVIDTSPSQVAPWPCCLALWDPWHEQCALTAMRLPARAWWAMRGARDKAKMGMHPRRRRCAATRSSSWAGAIDLLTLALAWNICSHARCQSAGSRRL